MQPTPPRRSRAATCAGEPNRCLAVLEHASSCDGGHPAGTEGDGSQKRCLTHLLCEIDAGRSVSEPTNDKGDALPITAFNSFTDGLAPNRRSREHFTAHINVEDDRLWVPYAEGVWFQPCCFNITSGGFSVMLKGLPGAKLGVHYHVGTVHGYTMRGHWRNWSMTGLPSPERISTNQLARLTRWSSPTTHRNQR